MKILITGASGFLGSRLAAYYEKKHTVLGLRRTELDFTDKEQTAESVRAFSPDVIIHCGAISDVGACAQNPGLSMSVNVKGTRYLASAAAQTGARFVFCSSDQVYFSQPDEAVQPQDASAKSLSDSAAPQAASRSAQAEFLTPHRETELLAPLPLYGQHKLLAEQACLEEQPDSVILRLTWMYDHLTARELESGRRNLTVSLEQALRTGTALTFSETDHRGVTNVQDVIRQMEQVWQLPAGIYNYGSSNSMNMYETARQILSALGRPELLRKAEGGGLRNLTMNPDKTAACGIRFPDTADGVIGFLQKQQPIFSSIIPH